MPNVPTRTATIAMRYLRSQRSAIIDAIHAPGTAPIEIADDCSSVRDDRETVLGQQRRHPRVEAIEAERLAEPDADRAAMRGRRRRSGSVP